MLGARITRRCRPTALTGRGLNSPLAAYEFVRSQLERNSRIRVDFLNKGMGTQSLTVRLNIVSSLVLLLSLASSAYAQSNCAEVSGKLAHEFRDIHGEISHYDLAALSLLTACSARSKMCVVVEGGSGTDYELAEANKGSDLSRAKQKNAVSMFAVAMSNSKRGKIC